MRNKKQETEGRTRQHNNIDKDNTETQKIKKEKSVNFFKNKIMIGVAAQPQPLQP